jgi:hypothetical protein
MQRRGGILGVKHGYGDKDRGIKRRIKRRIEKGGERRRTHSYHIQLIKHFLDRFQALLFCNSLFHSGGKKQNSLFTFKTENWKRMQSKRKKEEEEKIEIHMD